MTEPLKASRPERDRAAVDPPHPEHARPDAGEPAVRRREAAVAGRAFGSESDPLGGTAAAPDVTAALQRRRGGGSPLPDTLAADFGQQLGADLTGVRVHTDAEAGQIARSVQAVAFTHGSDIYFGEGAYAPGSSSGRHLIAHEVAHVVQQGSGGGAASGGGPVIGRADDPAEAAADRVADHLISGIQRTRAAADTGARIPSGPTDIHRLFGFGKKKGDGSAPKDSGAPAEKPDPKKQFEAATKGKKPKNADEARTRMESLRTLLAGMTADDRTSIATDEKLMAKARTYVGKLEYISLVAAVGMAYKPPAKKGKKAPTGGVNHMSGAEADQFIQTNMGAIAHLKPFMDAAIGAGKKADGFIAVVGQKDWERIYGLQYDDPVGEDEELTTNAFVADANKDEPAIIHHDRGTRSTAIHESIHRYAPNNVLDTYGFDLNEGITEYFTRLITDKDGNPVNGGASNRTNYSGQWRFVCDLVPMLGADLVAQQTELAEIYFNGQADRIKTHFVTACKAANLSDEDTARRWADFEAALKAGDWDVARAKFPPPPAPAPPPPPPVTAPTDAPPPAPPEPVGVPG